MGGVMSPGRRQGIGLLDTVMKGLDVASQVYGIKKAADQADEVAAAKEKAAATEARLGRGEYLPGEVNEKFYAKGYAPAKQGDQGAFEVSILPAEGKSPLKQWVAKVDGTKIAPPRTRAVNTVENGKEVTKIVEDTPGASYPAYQKPEKPAKDLTVNERNTLQNQYDRDPNTRKNQLVLGSYADMQALLQEKSPAADQALVFAYMKSLDPGSVVKESEAESAQALGAMGERAKAWYAKNVGGDGMLSDAQRADLAAQVTKLAKSAAQKQSAIDNQFKDLAGRRSVDTRDLRFSILPAFEDQNVASQLEVTDGMAVASPTDGAKIKKDLKIPQNADADAKAYAELHNLDYMTALSIMTARKAGQK